MAERVPLSDPSSRQREVNIGYYPAEVYQRDLDPSAFAPGCGPEDVQRAWPEAPSSWLEVHECRSKVVTVIAGRQGGKSTGINGDFVVFGALSCPPEVVAKFQGALESWYIAPTLKQAKTIIWERMKAVTKDVQAYDFAPNESDLRIKLVNGMFLRLKGGDMNEDQLRGSPLWRVNFDEPRDMASTVWYKCVRPATTSKMIVENGGGRATFITSPNGHDWVYQLYLEGQNDPTGRNKSWRYGSWQAEYSNLAELAFIYADHKKRGDLATWRQEYAADFVGSSGAIYKTFSRDLHVKPFEIDESWDLCVGVDNGCEDPTVFLLGAVDHYGRVWIRHEYYQKDMPISEHARSFKRLMKPYTSRGQEPTLMVMDGTNRQLFREYSAHGLYFSSARNVKDSVVPGIHRVQECLLPLNDSLPGLMIHPECEMTIRQMQAYQWKKQSDPEKDGWEIPLKSNDHTCDVVRYICMARPEPAKIVQVRGKRTMADVVREERELFFKDRWKDESSDECDPVIGGRW